MPLALVAAVVLAGCGENRAAVVKTQLTMLVTNWNGSRAAFHLSCQPPRGDFPSPAKSCAWVEKDPKIVTKPKLIMCIGPSVGPQVDFSGLIDGRPVRSDFSLCGWTYGMRLVRVGLYGAFVYNDFGKHLLPLRPLVLKKPTVKTYPPGKLEPADLVSCDIAGSHIELPVPFVAGWEKTPPLLGTAILNVYRHHNGSVTVSCRKR